MKRLIASLGFMLLASPVFAKTTLVTSPLFVGPVDVITCNMVNSATKPLTVLVSLTRADGTVISSSPVTVNPGIGSLLINNPGAGAYYCSFEFSGGSSKSIRGSVLVADHITGNTIGALPAS
jgi:hypothetical protein